MTARLRLTRPEPTEAVVQNAVLRLLQVHPRVAKAVRYNSGAGFAEHNGKKRFFRFTSAKGHSDIGGVLKGGRAFYFEVKRPSGELTDDQRLFLEEMASAGALTGVVRSVEDAAALLEGRA